MERGDLDGIASNRAVAPPIIATAAVKNLLGCDDAAEQVDRLMAAR